ncbi:MAG: glycine zipper 2TM domain-containing protein [Steroidobacteraceae bacterium]
MIKPIFRHAFAVSLALATGAVLVGCNGGAVGTASVGQDAATQPKTVAREQCHDEVITRTAEPKDRHQVAGTAVGAVIGGVLGNQFGSGDGKKLATVTGAVAGGYAGNKIQENNQEKNTYQETKRVCKTVYDKV